MSSTDLRAADVAPHPRRDRGHVTIVFTALAVARDPQTAAAPPIDELICHLPAVRSTTITITGAA